jgi:hypothetical protein
MNNKTIKVLVVAFLIVLGSCSKQTNVTTTTDSASTKKSMQTVEPQPHNYGGWYCPDNLNGFPAVDIANWKNVPVVNGRMATEEETHNGASLINVDLEKYPNTTVLDITLPKMASIYNKNTARDELIIVIQAINVSNDSIVGFRYLNGGNGSARLDEIKFLSDSEIKKIPEARFVAIDIQINASQDEIWQVLTNAENAETLRPTFDVENNLRVDWRLGLNVNYHYHNAGKQLTSYADKLFGCFYVQNYYEELRYGEKFLLLENQETGITELKISCGPFAADFETQKSILNNWGQKVKTLSEKQ